MGDAPRAMRILHIFDHSVPLFSGYTFRSLSILREQRALGWETVHITSTKHTGAKDPIEEIDGLRFYRTLPTGGWLERTPLLHQAEVIRSLAARLREVVSETQPDILHAHSPCLNGLAALLVGFRRRLPVVYELRALWEDGAVNQGRDTEGSLRYRLSAALETFVLRRADAVTTICEGLRQEIMTRGVAPERVTVIPNAVDPARFTVRQRLNEALAERLGLTGTVPIGFIGSFYTYEGLQLLVAALPRLLAVRPKVRLVLVGGGDEEAALRQQARALGIEDKIVFAGWVPHHQVEAYYDLLDILIYPRQSVRLTELVTPLKPLEAMARGRAVIASDVGGHQELIRHKETGLLFRADDVGALVDAVLTALSDGALVERMQQAARRFVENERSWRASVARYVPVYESLTQWRR